MKKIIQQIKRTTEIISYLFWGCMTTLVSWGSYSIFVYLGQGNENKIWNMPANVLFANAVSWLCAMTFAFITNKIFVFKSKNWHINIFLAEFWKFASFRLITGGIEILAVPFFVSLGLNQHFLGIEGSISKLTVSIIMVIVNYFLSKMVVFKTKSKTVRKNGKGEL